MIKTKKSSQLALVLALSLLFSPIAASAQGLSKTPKISEDGIVISETEQLEKPADYPADINEWLDQNVDARSYLVVDVETDKILAQKQATQAYPIASMTKIIPTYLVFKAIDEGKISMDTKITVPQEIEDHLSFNPELSAMGLHAGAEYTVEDLLYGVMLASGNDATSTLMWELYGSEQDAVQAIRDLLNSWGVTNYQIYTTSGAPNQLIPEEWHMPDSASDSENIMSATELAYVAKKIITEYPDILKISSTDEYTAHSEGYEDIYLSNHNELLPGHQYGREGITGLKSGMTDAAGRCFIATGNENGRDIIAIAAGVFQRDDGIETNSYWDLEIILDKLAEYPDLYQLEGLPTISHNQTEEEKVEESVEESEAELPAYENKRDSGLTNFMRKVKGIFKK